MYPLALHDSKRYVWQIRFGALENALACQMGYMLYQLKRAGVAQRDLLNIYLSSDQF